MGERADVRIDPDRLEKALLSRNMTRGVATKQLNRQSGYVTKILKRGTMTQATVYVFEHVLGIPPEEYVVDKMVEPAAGTTEIDYGKLYQVIYDAVYTAVKKAWEDE